ncbi:gamma-glutamyl-gamma-aminobutyrate hydrolase family protein [Shewanella waksmanii]|uniref:gamma-glutamyl-gamma-aminobutyrate hydrolase family protein n=1 Tax=Shewanella waksmanii TaxID=213783 RepID=UPI003735C77B
MIPILITQHRIESSHSEQHDSLDQRWHQLLNQAGILAVPVPNNPNLIENYWQTIKPHGVILSGGGSYTELDTDCRSRTEDKLLDLCIEHNLPVLGICRGMQVLLQKSGHELLPVKGHIHPKQSIIVNCSPITLNSYHDFGVFQVNSSFRAWAHTTDGVIKAVEHKNNKLIGIMWHPERGDTFLAKNIQFLQTVFMMKEFPCAHLF